MMHRTELRLLAFSLGLGITSDYLRVVWLNIWLHHGEAVISFTLWPWFEKYIEPLLLIGTMVFFAIMMWGEVKYLWKSRKPPVIE